MASRDGLPRLVQLFPKDDHKGATTVDIIAIHGIETHSPQTWIAHERDEEPRGRATNWLCDEDMLPKVVPQARIWAYDYNSNCYSDDAQNIDILGLADSFLEFLWMAMDKDIGKRPLVFIGSCFGGILIAQALVRASRNQIKYTDLLSSTSGIIFLGTPLRGTATANLMEWLVILRRFMGKETSNTLPQSLREKASDLDAVVQDFATMAISDRLQIRCFYETRETQIVNAVASKRLAKFFREVKLVSKESASLDGHKRIALNVRHAMMNKFRGPQDGSFKLVSGSLKELVENARISQRQTKKEGLASRKQKVIIDYLAPDTEAVDFKEGFISGHWHSSSGEWLKTSHEYQMWWGSKGGLLWCSGVAGAGKTVLANIISDDLKSHCNGDDDKQVIRIFFDHTHKHLPQQYLASLWKQLALRRSFDDYERTVLDNMYVKQSARPDEKKWKEMLSQEVHRYSRVFLIVDALDESQFGSPVQFVKELIGRLPLANVLITTRPHLKIENANIVGRVRMIEIKAHETDLMKYFKTRVSNSENLEYAINKMPGLDTRIKDQVLKNSKGMFLLAKLLMDDLDNSSTPSTVQYKLDNPPTNLDEAYDTSFSRIENQKGEAASCGKEVLYTLCVAKTPITFDQLRCILSLRENTVSLSTDDYVYDNFVVGKCAGLVIVDQKTKVIRFGHETTRDYLHNFQSSGIAKARLILLKKCLVYLRFPAVCLEFWSENYQIRELLLKHPFLEYAAVYWGDHAREVGTDDNEDLITDIMDLIHKDENLACATRVLLYKTSRDWIEVHKWGAWGAEQRTKGKMRGINLVAYCGLDNILARILQDSPDGYLRSGDPFGNVVHWAARGNHEAVLKRLMVQPGIQQIINDHSELGHTPMHVALVFGKTRALEILLENGANSTIKVSRGPDWHSLQLAIWYGPPKHVEMLLGTGKTDTLLWARDVLKRLALNIAAGSDDTESLGKLLPLYAKAVDSQHQVKELIDHLGRNPLHQAAQSGHQRATEDILEHSLGQIFLRGTNYRRQTPFQVAAFTGRLNVVKTYCDRVDREWLLTQHEALFYAAWRGHSEVLREMLNFFGSSRNAQYLYRQTLARAVDNGGIESVEDVTRRIDFAANDPGLTEALFMAAPRGHIEVVRHLLKKGTPVNTQDEEGSTALHLAASKHMSSMVRALLKAQSALDIGDKTGKTPLSLALQNKDIASSKLLLQYGSLVPQLDAECQRWVATQSWWARYSIPPQDGSLSKENIKSDGDNTFSPSSADEVFRAALYLNKALGSQPETRPIVNWILELAEYWIATCSQRDGEHWYDENEANPVYLRSLPIIGRESKPVRQIVFHITSHDQSSESGPGDFGGYTWFSIERQSAGQRSDHVRLLKNKHHRKEWTRFNISWPHQQGFDRTPFEPNHDEKETWLTKLGRGDRVLVIPKAELQAWRNFVQRAEMTIYTTCLRKAVYRRVSPSTGHYLAMSFAT